MKKMSALCKKKVTHSYLMTATFPEKKHICHASVRKRKKKVFEVAKTMARDYDNYIIITNHSNS